MGTAVSVCRNVLDVALKEEGELSAALASQYGPQLLLRVDAAPIRDGPAVFPNPFRLTDEIILEGVEGLAAYDPFMSRFNLARRAESGSKFPFTWPDTDRVCMPHVFMRARIEGTGRYVLLQICASVADQKLHRVLAALQDCKEVVQQLRQQLRNRIGIYRSVYLCIYSIYFILFLTFCLFHLSVYLSTYLSVCLSISLSYMSNFV